MELQYLSVYQPFLMYWESDAMVETSLAEKNERKPSKPKRYSSSTAPENVKCDILKRGLHYAINDVEMYP